MSKVEKPATCWIGDGVVDVDFAAMVKTRTDSCTELLRSACGSCHHCRPGC
jgi:hypothetical protein